jgi:hypothetical protein
MKNIRLSNELIELFNLLEKNIYPRNSLKIIILYANFFNDKIKVVDT